MKKNGNHIDNRNMHFNNAASKHSAQRRKNKRTRLVALVVLALLLAVILVTYGCRTAANLMDTDSTTTETAETTTREQTTDDEAVTQEPTESEPAETDEPDPTTETEPEATTEATTEETTEATTVPEETAAQEPPSDDAPVIALTFDDGPAVDGEDQLTERLLNLLAEENVTATFFVLGNQIDAGREDTVRRTWQEGHEIANHSYSHVIFTETDEQRVRDELTRTNELIENITGERPRLMRPPTGAYNALVQDISRDMDLAIVNWSWQSTPEDWNYHDNPDFIAEHVVEHAANGHIVLLHDINRATIKAMPEMIAGLKERGFRFMTVSDLLSHLGGDHPKSGAVYTHFSLPID